MLDLIAVVRHVILFFYFPNVLLWWQSAVNKREKRAKLGINSIPKEEAREVIWKLVDTSFWQYTRREFHGGNMPRTSPRVSFFWLCAALGLETMREA
jgi:hypothetical protein